jgi:hypothetical protein
MGLFDRFMARAEGPEPERVTPAEIHQFCEECERDAEWMRKQMPTAEKAAIYTGELSAYRHIMMFTRPSTHPSYTAAVIRKLCEREAKNAKIYANKAPPITATVAEPSKLAAQLKVAKDSNAANGTIAAYNKIIAFMDSRKR